MSRTACFIFLSGALLLASRPAGAHALLVNPMPRDQQDGYKDPPRTPPGTGAPCGISEAASQPHNTLIAGTQLTVKWDETVTHPGCFVIDFSPANDANFTVLGVKSHMNAPTPTNPSQSNPRHWSVSVTLPNTPCTKCTLRLRQLMLNADVTDAQCPPATIPTGSTYYSCSNVALNGATTGSGGTGGSGTGTGGSAAGGRGGSTGAAGRGGSGAAGTTGAAGTVATGGSSGEAGSTGAAGSVTTGRGGDVGGPAGSGVNPTGIAGSPVDPTGAGGSNASGAAGSAVDPSGAAGHAGPPPVPESGGGGCTAAGTASPLASLLMLGLLVSRQRRRRRRSRS